MFEAHENINNITNSLAVDKLMPLNMTINNYIASVQVLGWSMWFAEYIFLERNWKKDETSLKVYLNNFSCTYTIFISSILIYTCLDF